MMRDPDGFHRGSGEGLQVEMSPLISTCGSFSKSLLSEPYSFPCNPCVSPELKLTRFHAQPGKQGETRVQKSFLLVCCFLPNFCLLLRFPTFACLAEALAKGGAFVIWAFISL